MLIILIANLEQASAHDPSFSFTGFGTATIDGVLSPGEWDTADTFNFQANLPALEGGGTTPATLFVMNDANNLYLALRVERPSLDSGSSFFEFDNDHDGVREAGDEAIGTNTLTNFNRDNFRDAALNGPTDISDGGTEDGVSGSSNDGTFTVVERSHPLNSADDAHDFSLNIGDTVGFVYRYTLLALGGTFPDNTASTILPFTSVSQAQNFGDIIIASSPGAAVGGELLPLDTTALLLAGVQMNAAWIIPVVAAGIGIGVFVIKRRK